MTIISRVCAEFRNKNGETIFRIGRNDLGRMLIDTPEAIREDPLFALLVRDRSIEVANLLSEQKALEQDPFLGIGADGKSVDAAAGSDEETEAAEAAPAGDRTEEKKPGRAAKK